ncbi:hypothetical protein SRHO_G00149740 [Serrasalmus rhombeus]
MERERGSCRANPSVKARIIMEVIMTQPLWPRPWGLHTFSPLPTYRSARAGNRKRASPASKSAAFSTFWRNFHSQKALGPVDEMLSRWHRSQGQMEQGIAAQCECPLSRAVIDGSAHLPQHTSAIPTLTLLPLRAKRHALQRWSGALQSQLNHQHVITESL